MFISPAVEVVAVEYVFPGGKVEEAKHRYDSRNAVVRRMQDMIYNTYSTPDVYTLWKASYMVPCTQNKNERMIWCGVWSHPSSTKQFTDASYITPYQPRAQRSPDYFSEFLFELQYAAISRSSTHTYKRQVSSQR
ncbi:hypothetical protein NXS19_004184 [Fusarium pseudograminearum]|nr:hypothetical protein NXS19_004184 [Fusarium pseudograminearum]